MEVKYENKEICKECGGKCCKKCGCDYLPKDFEDLSTNGLLERITGGGDISIISTLNISILPNGKKVIDSILLLRERNINRPIVDLLSYKTSCASLTEQGCKYDFEHRPSGGKNLIPRENGKCYDPTSLNKVEVWLSYQKVLQRVVKRITGKTVEECLKEDVINLFMDFMLDNTSGVSDNELQEIVILIPHLIQAFPEEYQLANEMCKNSLTRTKIRKRP